MPARAPPSILILQIVIRCSNDREETVLPLYSITCPVPPSTPMSPTILRIISLAQTPLLRLPVKFTESVLGFLWRRH